MAYELRDMSGSAFKNNRRDRDTSPHMTGSAKLFGKEVWVNVWKKTDKNGETWISFGFKEKEQKPQQDNQPTSEAISDDIPF